MNEEKVNLKRILLIFPAFFLVSVILLLTFTFGREIGNLRIGVRELLIFLLFFPGGIFVYFNSFAPGVYSELLIVAGYLVFIGLFILALIFREKKYFRIFLILWIGFLILNMIGDVSLMYLIRKGFQDFYGLH
jgi:hypothetical protein